MKKLILILPVLAFLAGCSTTPTPTEQHFFDITTNYVPRVVVITNVVALTNFATVTVTNTLTMVSNQVVITPVTNVTLHTAWETNVIKLTNMVEQYYYVPGTNAATIGAIGKAIGEPFGVGGIISTLIAGLFAGWATWRNRTNQAKGAQLAGVLVQAIETGSEILKTTPQGITLDAQWKDWMMKNQKEAGVLMNVLDLLDDVVDNQTAREVAAKLLALMKERQPPAG